LTAGGNEGETGGSGRALWLECAAGRVSQKSAGPRSAVVQTGGSVFQEGEGRVHRWLVHPRQGGSSRLMERVASQRSVLHGRSGFAGDWAAAWSTGEGCGGPLQERVDSWCQRQAERTIWTGLDWTGQEELLVWGGSAAQGGGGGAVSQCVWTDEERKR
jgi:hypothetical protein